MEGLMITKDSKLVETYWDYEEEKKEGSYKTREISHLSPHVLHENGCSLEDGLTLRNIFEYMSKDISAWGVYIGNWCEEFVTEGLKESEHIEKELEYLELYWSYQISEYKNEEPRCEFGYRMDFHGKGIPDEHGGQNYSLTFSPVNELANLPVKVNTEVNLCETDYINYKDKKTILGKQSPTLFQIIYGIIWELSFHGGPSQRDTQKEELMTIVKDLKERYPNDFKGESDV